jgi:predicted acetyltransferase
MTLRIATDKDRTALIAIVAHTYGIPRANVPGWFERSGHENVMAYEEDGILAGCLHVLPMGQFFAGRRASTAGVQGVAIAVPARGNGAAARMMQAFLREMRARKVALSTLYAATLTLYRHVGYERAGLRYRTSIDLRKFSLPRSGLAVAELNAPDDACQKLYRKVAQRTHGYLDRGSASWRRIVDPRDREPRTFTVTGKRGIEGYVVVEQKMGAANATSVSVLDAVAHTRAAALAIWTLLRQYKSLANEVTLEGGAESLLHAVLPERHYTQELLHSWMIRILNPKLALSQRGYPAISARTTLLLSDASIPENSGAYELVLTNGKPKVVQTKSERGIRITERGLAALYSGLHSSTMIRDLSLLACSDAECATLAAIFGGYSPTMADMF